MKKRSVLDWLHPFIGTTPLSDPDLSAILHLKIGGVGRSGFSQFFFTKCYGANDQGVFLVAYTNVL